MNKQEKQELIEWISKFSVTKHTALGRIVLINTDVLVNKIQQLDESQKVKVPAFVADWIEEVKQRGCGLADALDCFASPIMPYFIKEWLEFNSSVIGCHHDYQELLARAWLDGYEVEEEPRWIVKYIPPFVDEFRYYSMDDEIFDITESSWTSDKEDAYPFTEKEKAEAVALLVDGSVEEV